MSWNQKDQKTVQSGQKTAKPKFSKIRQKSNFGPIVRSHRWKLIRRARPSWWARLDKCGHNLQIRQIYYGEFENCGQTNLTSPIWKVLLYWLIFKYGFLQWDQNWIFGGFLKILVFAVFCPLLAFFRKFQSQLLSHSSPVSPCQLEHWNQSQDLCNRHQGLPEKWY